MTRIQELGVCDRLTDYRARYAVLCAFVIAVFALGGSSRDDVFSLIILRPLALLTIAYAVICLPPKNTQKVPFVLLWLAALAALTVLQLVPLPPDLWQALPGREAITANDEALGLGSIFRPLSLTPDQTLNTLFSLSIPIAACLLYQVQNEAARAKIWDLVLGALALSALIGLLQSIGGSDGPLYMYRITNSGSAVGLFANRNHQALMLAIAIILIGSRFSRLRQSSPRSGAIAALLVMLLIFLIPSLFLTGSRAGIGLGAVGAVFAALLIGNSDIVPDVIKVGRRIALDRSWVRKVIAFIFVSLFATLLLVRTEAIDRMFIENPAEELRGALIPTLAEMAKQFFPFGSGFGSFDQVYKLYEPIDLLGYRYLNHAHNDLVQFVIEGGVVAILLMVVLTWQTVRLIFVQLRSPSYDRQFDRVLALSGVILLIVLASVVDYPLRVPSIMMVAALVHCSLSNTKVRSDREFEQTDRQLRAS